MWCDSQKQKGFATKCPFCNQSIEKDCAALEPGQPMPEHRIREILRIEDFEAMLAKNDGQRVAELREKKQTILEKLRFPKNFKYDNWQKITNFDLAKRFSINREKVGRELGLEL
jgi:adenine-specific DNA glycosylase